MRKAFFIVSIGLIAASIQYQVRPSLRSRAYATQVPAPAPPGINQASTASAVPATPHPTLPPAFVRHATPKTSSPSQALHIPLEFEANRGQAPGQYSYVAHGPTYSLGLSTGEIALSLHRPEDTSQNNPLSAAHDSAEATETTVSQLHLRLMGASPTAAVAGLE